MTPKTAAKFLARFRRSDGEVIFHITLSMPKGMILSDDDWLAVIRHVLAASGLPPDVVPWIAMGRENSTCDHVHVFGALSTFAGRPLDVNTSVAFTDALQLDLCHRLDLPEPPALQLPSRRDSNDASGPSKSMSFPIALENAFQRFRPTTVRALDTALRALSPRWALAKTDDPEEVLVLDRHTGATRNPRTFGKRYSSHAIFKRLADMARLESLWLLRFFARVAAHVPLGFFDTTIKDVLTYDHDPRSGDTGPQDRRDPDG
ncbi:MAG: hypothetical protein LPK90_02400, partial [Alphaproteobacteria bacterium]|nr:hypothetical protein [Alphaproteobacteria bacterium]